MTSSLLLIFRGFRIGIFLGDHFTPVGAEEERAGVNEVHTRRPIHSITGINFTGAGSR
jgi:hypothetical protein